ncbi:hypothetical protein AS156_15130 [Bradyrhizobium macuxiense]|uniref:Uncharacterized protein n=1 Tax=Bradyrhizobium macuxiense TaxID=1755647 RepID=A0A109JJ88_9BRAD|nr:hypothetical protein AS156_15130 [Bradyrhizobium macuxiense]
MTHAPGGKISKNGRWMLDAPTLSFVLMAVAVGLAAAFVWLFSKIERAFNVRRARKQRSQKGQ